MTPNDNGNGWKAIYIARLNQSCRSFLTTEKSEDYHDSQSNNEDSKSEKSKKHQSV